MLEEIGNANDSMHRMNYDVAVFRYCRNLVLEIDWEMFVYFHQKNRQLLSKDYRDQYKRFVTNLRDGDNY